MANLPVVIFQFAMSPYEDWQTARLGRRAPDHLRRAGAEHPGARAVPARSTLLNAIERVHGYLQPETAATAARRTPPRKQVAVRNLNFYYGKYQALKRRRLDIADKRRSRPSSAPRVAASPPCCASSTACTTSIPGSAPTGEILLDGENILDREASTSTALRARVGMVFQKPTPFPMSIYDNIAFGVQLYERLSRAGDGRARRMGAAPRRRCGTRSRTS